MQFDISSLNSNYDKLNINYNIEDDKYNSGFVDDFEDILNEFDKKEKNDNIINNNINNNNIYNIKNDKNKINNLKIMVDTLVNSNSNSNNIKGIMWNIFKQLNFNDDEIIQLLGKKDEEKKE